jgi:molybdenum cofactor sulfurtransferase
VTYLDHSGAAIYARSLIDEFSKDIITSLYGNPHSECEPARRSRRKVDEIRTKALRFFGANPECFDLVFVANATAAIKLVMEAFRNISNASRDAEERRGFWYGYHADSHTSIVGVRESTNGHSHMFQDDQEVEQWISEQPSDDEKVQTRLFAYPGQSNMTGRRLPLSWPGRVRQSANDTYTLLDAAALAPTYPMHSVFQDPNLAPDFTVVSFSKIFGYPDLGGLIVRKASGNILETEKVYFGGGTVSIVTVVGNKPWFKSKEILHESLEDGTLPFHNIIALGVAIDTHERLYGPKPMEKISCHTAFLCKYLYDSIASLRYSTGMQVCHIYKGGRSEFGDSTTQGPTIAFNIVRRRGTFIPCTSIVDTLADEQKVFVRTGDVCNPGGVATLLGLNEGYMKLLWDHGHYCGAIKPSTMEILNGRPTGVVRVSLGAMTRKGNVDVLITFLRETFLTSAQFPMVRGLQPVVSIAQSSLIKGI